MNKWIQKIETPQLEKLKSEEKSSVNIGDTVKIGVQIREGDRTRVQNYQGIITNCEFIIADQGKVMLSSEQIQNKKNI